MSVFEIALARTLEHEGGYVDDPADPGGETNFGISKRAYPDVDIKALTREAAAKIYRREYWDKPGWGRLENAALAVKLFDLGVNCGTGRAVKFLQQALNLLGRPCDIDNRLGPRTVALANDYTHPAALLMAVRYQAAAYYVNLGKSRFLAGWLKRLAE